MFSSISEKFKAVIQYLRIFEHNIEAHYYRQPFSSEKSQLILRWAALHGGRIFVETGTWYGKTISNVASSFTKCYSIELDYVLYEAARERFKEMPWVQMVHGDSALAIHRVLEEIDGPTVFWLDAHYCGFDTAVGKGKRHTPILEELGSIFSHRVTNHLVLVDDARCFVGIGGYPTIRRLARFIRENGHGYEMRISDDVIVIYRESY